MASGGTFAVIHKIEALSDATGDFDSRYADSVLIPNLRDSEKDSSILNATITNASFRQFPLRSTDPGIRDGTYGKSSSSGYSKGPKGAQVKSLDGNELKSYLRPTDSASRMEKSSRATEYINSVLSEHEEGMFLNWRNDAQKEGRTATQILQ